MPEVHWKVSVPLAVAEVAGLDTVPIASRVVVTEQSPLSVTEDAMVPVVPVVVRACADESSRALDIASVSNAKAWASEEKARGP